MKIAVDAMGGDYAPEEVVLGAIHAVSEYKFDVVLVGDEQKIRNVLRQYGAKESDRLSIVHASEVIEMGGTSRPGCPQEEGCLYCRGDTARTGWPV